MIHNRIITENHLDDWVRRDSRNAQGLIVELVWRLVGASAPNPKQRRFPLEDSIGQHGPDGVLDTDIGFDPFVPEGISFWEVGTNLYARKKASEDYDESTSATPEEVRRESTFVFVTPLSGRRGWEHSWKDEAQASWLKDRRARQEWQDVRVIDGTVIIDWLHYFPAVERWLAKTLGLPIEQMETPEQRWDDLRAIGEPPPLTPHVFLANRDEASHKLKEVFSDTLLRLRLDTRYPKQAADFVAAYIASMGEEAKVEAMGRCLILSSRESLEAICLLRNRHILIADFDLDDTDSSNTHRLFEKAKRAGHAVVFGGIPGGVPDPNRIELKNAREYQIKEGLEKAGYTEERARNLAQKSDGNLYALLRCIQNLSLMPEWAQGGDAAELAIAALLGGWNENSETDKAAVEKLSGNTYGEWIGKMRETTLKPDAPLIHRDGNWKFVSRYEGWYALGPRIFDEHLERFKSLALEVLREHDPQFELPPEKRYMAQILGKAPKYSRLLANGIAESLALLGSHPKALTSCSFGKAETTAVLVIRELLTNANAVQWASLNNLLPLLAEAAPNEFLTLVENALNSNPCPYDWVFQQEGKGAMGGSNYLTGLLWALETLAWDEDYLTRAVLLLGELAAHDPGGSWANRPANSLTTILLPWYPQTCASIAKRKVAVNALFNEIPYVGWKLLLSLLPSMYGTSSSTRKPAWRELIPDDWSKGATHQEYWDQTEAYAELAINAAKQDISKLGELIDRLDNLQPAAMKQILTHLTSDNVVSMPETERLQIWEKLIHLILKHRKFADTEWALSQDTVNEIDSIANILIPNTTIIRYKILFIQDEFSLYDDEDGDWEKQNKKLENERQQAVSEIYYSLGINGIIEFSKSVEVPWRVGFSFGSIIKNNCETLILQNFLESETKSLAQFAAGFINGRYLSCGWKWVDDINISSLTPSEKGQLFAYLPFTIEAWERIATIFGQNDYIYWSKTYVNPTEDETGLDFAIDKLIEHGRPLAAINCIHRSFHRNKQLSNTRQAVSALLAALHTSEMPNQMSNYAIVNIIKALQVNSQANHSELVRIEWAYLKLLSNNSNVAPNFLEQQLANDPNFFCEVIRLIFRSNKVDRATDGPTEEQKNIATNAYRLLSEWKTPPGSTKDGSFNDNALSEWLKQVIASSTESGHLDIALSKFGEVLIHAPADPDGLWIHRAVAKILNDKDAEAMRNGYSSAWFNSRGAYWVDPTGQEERNLAEGYRSKAEAVDAHGYYRLAETLRELANSYEREAERQALRDSIDEFR